MKAETDILIHKINVYRRIFSLSFRKNVKELSINEAVNKYIKSCSNYQYGV